MARASGVKNEQVSIPRVKINDDLITAQKKQAQYNYPFSPATTNLHRIYGAQGDIRAMAARSNRHPSAHGRQIAYSEKDGAYILEFRSGKSKYVFQIPDLEKISKYNKGTKKIFNYLLIKLNQQAYSDGVFRRNYISFPLQELIEIGIYADKKSARRGFMDAMTALVAAPIGGEIDIKGKKPVSQSKISVMFYDAEVTNGECIVKLNESLNWSFVAQFYTILPAFYFALPAKAADLCQYIFERARQSQDDIKEKGSFTIKLRSIAQFLGLPDETEARNPSRDIRQRIEEAIEDIEKKMEADDERGALKLTPQVKDRVSITEYLDNGYLRVDIAGSYADYFIKNAESNEREREKARKKKEKIVEAAKIKSLAERMKNDDKKKWKGARENGALREIPDQQRPPALY